MSEALSNRCVLKGGSGFPERFQGDRGGEVPFIKVSDMNSLGNERYITVANNYVSAKTATMLNATIFPAGSIVFAKVGAALLLNRRRILSAPTIIDNNMMAAITTSGDLDFLYHFLCSCDFSSLVQSGAVPSVNQRQIGGIQIPIFTERTQRKIATILSTIDTAIEQTEALIEKYQHIKAGLMHDLFTRGVLPTGQLRPPREQAPELYQETAIGWIPREWLVQSFGSNVLIVDPNPSHRYPDEVTEGVPICSTENFDGVDKFDLSRGSFVSLTSFENQNIRCQFQKNDVVFARKGRIGLVDRQLDLRPTA